ncbi:hypothetical protein J5491_02095 [Candidatus Saccharibacteria bacterium]|nr:hypothetical protein [Candidatus Saccharibacteria bacterium]
MEGRTFLEELKEKTDISKYSLELIKVVGPGRFCTALKNDAIESVIWVQIVDFFENSPERIKEALESDAKIEEIFDPSTLDLFKDEKEACYASAVKALTIEEVEVMTYDYPDWLDGATKMVRGLIKMTREYYDEGGHDLEAFGYFIDRALEEAIDQVKRIV